MGKGVVHLTDDLWGIIGSKLDTPSDRFRFRAVSKSWRSLFPYRQPPWLMLAQSHVNNDDDNPMILGTPPPRGVVCLGEQEIHEINLPEIHHARCVGSTGNWLAIIHLEFTIRLLNPFTRAQFLLPPPSTFGGPLYSSNKEEIAPGFYRDVFVKKIVLSSPPTEADCIAVAIQCRQKLLTFARPGDASWKTVEGDGLPTGGFGDVIFYKQKMCVVTLQARLAVFNIRRDDPTLSYITGSLMRAHAIHVRYLYLVECADELLLVVKFISPNGLTEEKPVYTSGFQVYKFDFATKKCEGLESLGEHSLFLGINTSISLLASDYYGFVRRNCIYFTDDFTYESRHRGCGGCNMGVFNLEDNSITPHFRGVSNSLYPPPVWIVPP